MTNPEVSELLTEEPTERETAIANEAVDLSGMDGAEAAFIHTGAILALKLIARSESKS